LGQLRHEHLFRERQNHDLHHVLLWLQLHDFLLLMFRSEAFRRLVCELPCQHCGTAGRTQPAHRNRGKGMGIKVSDALCAALCVECHRELDQGKDMSRHERHEMWDQAYIRTMQTLIEQGHLKP
jgi:hypothetical protein